MWFLWVTSPAVHMHYSDVIMSAMLSQITGVSIVCSSVCRGADQRIHQSSASLTLVGGNLPATRGFPSQRASDVENVPTSWHHHGMSPSWYYLQFIDPSQSISILIRKNSNESCEWNVWVTNEKSFTNMHKMMTQSDRCTTETMLTLIVRYDKLCKIISRTFTNAYTIL